MQSHTTSHLHFGIKYLPYESSTTAWQALHIKKNESINEDQSFPFAFLFAVEEPYGTRYQSGSFSLIHVGSGSHCLRSFILSELQARFLGIGWNGMFEMDKKFSSST
jgi:hypothetical protein